MEYDVLDIISVYAAKMVNQDRYAMNNTVTQRDRNHHVIH